MAYEECEKHEMIGCSICKPKPPIDPNALPDFSSGPGGAGGSGTVAAGISASRYGTCSSCGNTIEPGDIINQKIRTEFIAGNPVKVKSGWKHGGCP